MFEKTYRALAQYTGGTQVEVTGRSHRVLIDEPIAQGGRDEGMNPVEMLLCSIASCLTLGLTINAEAMGIALQEVSVEVEGDMDSAGSRGYAHIRPGYSHIRTNIRLRTDAPDSFVQQLVDLACLRCPVEDSVRHGVEFSEPVISVER